MKIIPPITIDDDILTSSNVEDTVYVAPVCASGTITVSAQPSVGETFMIDTQTFTFVTLRSATGQVTRSSDVNTQAENIKTAVNTDLPGLVTAERASAVVTITADAEGAGGNAIVFTESATGIAVSGSGTLAGGVDEVAGNVEYNAATTYAAGDMVVVTSEHTLYESLAGSNLNHTPSSSPTWWQSIGKTNRWLMFDTMVTSQTANAGLIEVVLTPGQAIDSVAVMNVNASSVRILMHDTVGGDVYDETVVPTRSGANIVKTDLPDDYPDATVTVTITNTGDNAKCGHLVIGNYEDLGETQYGTTVRLISYSIKSVDEWGNYTITKRSHARRIEDCPFYTTLALAGYVKRILVSCRSTPAVIIASELYSIMTILGFVKDWKIKKGVNVAKCTATFEGLI